MFTFGFYDSKDGDRKYNSEQMSSIFDGIIEDGVYSNVGEALMTVPGTGLQVIVKTGRAWFKHTWSLNDAYMPLSIEEPDVYRGRIDAVVLEINKNLDVRANEIKVVTGTPATSPQKPVMKHEEGIDQYALAYVTVDPEVDSIAESKIEIAVGKNETPFVQCPLKTVSVEDLFNQWQGEFDEWFSNVKAQLEGDVVTNLQRQIDARVKIADKATEEDVKNKVPNKWLDPPLLASSDRYLAESRGSIIYSPTVNLEEKYPGHFMACDQRTIDDPAVLAVLKQNDNIKLRYPPAYSTHLPVNTDPSKPSTIFSVTNKCRIGENNMYGDKCVFVSSTGQNTQAVTTLFIHNQKTNEYISYTIPNFKYTVMEYIVIGHEVYLFYDRGMLIIDLDDFSSTRTKEYGVNMVTSTLNILSNNHFLFEKDGRIALVVIDYTTGSIPAAIKILKLNIVYSDDLLNTFHLETFTTGSHTVYMYADFDYIEKKGFDKHYPSRNCMGKYGDSVYIVFHGSSAFLMDQNTSAYIFKLTIKPEISFEMIYEIGISSDVPTSRYYVWYLAGNKMIFIGENANGKLGGLHQKILDLDTLEVTEKVSDFFAVTSTYSENSNNNFPHFVNRYAPILVEQNGGFRFFFPNAFLRKKRLNDNLTTNDVVQYAMVTSDINLTEFNIVQYNGLDVVFSSAPLLMKGAGLIDDIPWISFVPMNDRSKFESIENGIGHTMSDYFTEKIDQDCRISIPADIKKINIVAMVDVNHNKIFVNYCLRNSEMSANLKTESTDCVKCGNSVYLSTNENNFLYYFRTDQLKLPYKKGEYIRIDSSEVTPSPGD